jgi:hypothetical protein
MVQWYLPYKPWYLQWYNAMIQWISGQIIINIKTMKRSLVIELTQEQFDKFDRLVNYLYERKIISARKKKLVVTEYLFNKLDTLLSKETTHEE